MVAPSLRVSESRYRTVFPNNGGTKSVYYAPSCSYIKISQLRNHREHITHYKIRFSLHPQPIPTPPTSLATMPVFSNNIQAETLQQQRIEQAQSEALYDMARRYCEVKAEQARESLRAEIELFYRLRPDLSLPGGVGQSIESINANLDHIGRLYPEFFPPDGEDLNQAEDEDLSEAELARNVELAESLRLELEDICRPLRSDLEHLRRHHPDLFLPGAEDLNQTEDEGSRRVEVEDLFEGMSNLFQPEDECSSGLEVEDLFEGIWTD